MKIPSRVFVVFAGLLILALPALPQEVSPEVKKSIDAVRKHIDELKGGKGVGELIPHASAAVKQALPEFNVVIARFRIYPVARIMPEGLRASNIFAVSKEGKVEHLKDVKTLEKFFRAHHPAVKSEKDSKTILAAWLSLSQEFHQDGMFKFEVLEKEFAVDGNKASGRVMVTDGGSGKLSAELMIDKDGKLAKAEEKAEIRRGIRPICQATKLLDADPLIRRICEQDLLIMGLSARDYLMEQRERASPELRAEIDRVWRQIQKNGR